MEMLQKVENDGSNVEERPFQGRVSDMNQYGLLAPVAVVGWLTDFFRSLIGIALGYSARIAA